LHLICALATYKNVVKHVVKDAVLELFDDSADRFLQLGQFEEALLFVVLAAECLDERLAEAAEILQHQLLHVLLLHVVGVVVESGTLRSVQVISTYKLL